MPRRQRGQAAVERTGAALEHLVIEYITPDEISPNSYNPNRQNDHEFSLLCRSIQEDGFTQPVIVASDGVIVDGEHRWRAARHLGLEAIPIVRVPMDAAQARVATLRHNRARGTEDLELSVEVLRDLERLGALEWAADSLQIEDEELERLLADIPAPEALAGEEFSEAWEPRRDVDSTLDTTIDRGDVTPQAADLVRQREAAMREARTEEDRRAIARDRSIYRVALTFTAEEAELVKVALGLTPAVRLIEMCRLWMEHHPESEAVSA